METSFSPLVAAVAERCLNAAHPVRPVAPALVVAFASGAIVGIGLLIRYGAGARKRAVPFGPFLALGGVVGLLIGDEIVDWYLDTFFRD